MGRWKAEIGRPDGSNGDMIDIEADDLDQAKGRAVDAARERDDDWVVFGVYRLEDGEGAPDPLADGAPPE